MLVAPAKMKVVLFEAKDNMMKAAREKTSLKIPIRIAARRGFILIPALSKNGAV